MKNLAFILLAAFSLAAYCQTDTITILHINDTHSTLAPLGPRGEDLKGTRGGIARAATIIGMTRMTESNVLTLHGGDLFVGDIFFNKYFGAAEMRIMNALGFDAMGVGNHEFDIGPLNLLTALDSGYVQFPLVSSNLILDAVPSLNAYIKPYTIKTIGSAKIGIFGLTTPDANIFSIPAPVVIDTGFAARAAETAAFLKNDGCKIVICLSHLGIYYDMGLAAAIPGIDVIISSHDHLLTEAPVEIQNPVTNKTTFIVQAGSNYQNIGKLKLIVTGSQVSKLSYGVVNLDNDVPEAPEVKDIVDNLITEIEGTWGIPFFSQQTGTATDYFSEAAESLTVIGKKFDTPVGNLVTDAYRWKTGTQIAIQVGGSTAQPLYQGRLVPADIFRMIGYGMNETDYLGYRLVTLKLKGTELFKGLEIGLQGIELNDELLPQVSGLIYKYDPQSPPFSRVREVYVNGLPLDTGAVYTVTANEFLVAALGGFGVDIVDPVVDTNAVEFRVVLDYIANLGGTISPVVRGNIYTEIKSSGAALPGNYQLFQNYPNPFNPETVINYQLPVSGFVSLRVYDALGSEVAVLVNEEKSAGSYRYNFNASRLASGTYIYEIRAGEFRAAKKMQFVK